MSPTELLHMETLFRWGRGEAKGKARGTPTVKPKRIHEENTVTFLPDEDPTTSCHINGKIPVTLCPSGFCLFSQTQGLANTSLCTGPCSVSGATLFPSGTYLACAGISEWPGPYELLSVSLVLATSFWQNVTELLTLKTLLFSWGTTTHCHSQCVPLPH